MSLRHAENVWRVYQGATPEEVRDGGTWYARAHHVARMLAAVARRDLRAAAGVLAALSPLNRWEDNVDDAFRLARDPTAKVRTTNPNRDKAVAILAGRPPEAVLSGDKILSFWRGIVDPLGAGHVAVDRHLHAAAVGERRRYPMPRTPAEYKLFVRWYQDVADATGRPVTAVASTVWLVMRRGGPGLPLSELPPLRPSCCGAPMHSKGRDGRTGRRLFRCAGCGRTRRLGAGRPAVRPRLLRGPDGWQVRIGTEGYPVTQDERDRWRVQIGKGHEYANSAGWQWLYRFLAMDDLGRRLRPDEHVHHVNGNRSDNRVPNLEVVAASYHGSLHAHGVQVTSYDPEFGRLVEWPWGDGPPWEGWLPRDRWLIGGRAGEVTGTMLRLADLGPLDVVHLS